VYVSVSSEVDACKENWLPEFFKSYFEGKIIAEKAAIDSVGDAKKVCFVKPTSIYGGSDFGLTVGSRSFFFYSHSISLSISLLV
jgi:hypothetical protein